MEHLIECVRKHPCIWQSNNPHNKNYKLKKAAWIKIMKKCDFKDVEEPKRIWQTLKISHKQALNRKKNTTEGIARFWKYEKQMEFLLPYITTRSKSITKSNTTTLPITDIDEIAANTVIDMSNFSKSDEIELKPIQLDIPPNVDQIAAYPERVDESLEERNLLQHGMKAKPLQKFFDNMYDEVNNLSEHLQIKVQKEIFNAVMEAKEFNLQKQNYHVFYADQ